MSLTFPDYHAFIEPFSKSDPLYQEAIENLLRLKEEAKFDDCPKCSAIEWLKAKFEDNITKTLQGRPYVRKRSILLIASKLIEGAKNF